MSHSEAEVKIEKHPEGVASIGSHRPIADGNPTEVERQRREKSRRLVRDVAGFLMAAAFGITSLGPNDPWVLFPGLVIALIAFVAFFLTVDLSVRWKTAMCAFGLALFGLGAYRASAGARKPSATEFIYLHSIDKDPPTTPLLVPNQPLVLLVHYRNGTQSRLFNACVRAACS